MRIVHLSDPLTVALDVVAWGAVHAATGYYVHRIPVARLARDRWWSHLRDFERDGRVYDRLLRVRRWKDGLPEAGALFPGGVSKRSLPKARDGGIERFAIETRRAELGHWLALCAAPAFGLWNPPLATYLMIVYAAAVNLPFVVIQRYNRARVERCLQRRQALRRERSTP
jgi:glycosyl-4,4'-diaponeurosporenoate acyltransferase